jgi:hypothetical protein
MPRRTRDVLDVSSVPPTGSYILPADPVKTAGYLIKQAGGVKQARSAVAAAAKLDRRPAHRPALGNDFVWLCLAANRQRDQKIKTKTEAIRCVAGEQFPAHAEPAKKQFVRRLLRKLGKQPLQDFAGLLEILKPPFPTP